ncbi:MAG: hypothetical protein IJ582_02600 [Prevotella sp.]|nr:hypothetical protein [Prevotella sp.]
MKRFFIQMHGIAKKCGLVACLCAMFPLTGFGQRSVDLDFQVDVVSNHIWRGTDLGDVSVQPTGTVSYRGAYASLFGSTGFSGLDIQRIDFTLGYKAPFGVNIGATSHWKSGLDYLNRYFFFDEKLTAHVFEGNIGYSCKYFNLQAYTMFWGNDFKMNGDRAYSTYIELSVPFRLGSVDLLASVGGTPMESAGWTTYINTPTPLYDNMNDYLYADGPAVVSVSLRATKSYRAGKFEIPVFMEFDANPYTQKAGVVAGVTLRPFRK